MWKVVKAGFAPAFFLRGKETAVKAGVVHRPSEQKVTLWPERRVPAGMVVVSGARLGLTYPLGQAAPSVEIDDFLIDQHEVTNEDYQKFVDTGGYQRREFWNQPFVREGRTVSWDEAIRSFQDATGRPGPATWEGGSYPKGKEKHPVAGVSWYEAAAYAEFVGKSLPSAYHWLRASQSQTFTELIAAGSNFRGSGTQPVGAPGAISGFGTVDMAGNVKEWCLNEALDQRRFILGGGFGEATYQFNFTDAHFPWERRANFGFRCVKLDAPASALAAAKVDTHVPDFWKEKPVSDEIFRAFLGLYAYDKTELNARVEETETTAEWTRQKISFDAAYGNERVIAHVYVPKSGSPPRQTVVFFTGASGMLEDKLSLSDVEEGLDFLIRSGRALIVPVFKGFYERRDDLRPGGKPPALFRDHVIAWSKDLGRSLDYLATRTDIDATRLAYLGFSHGSSVAPVMLSVESRFRAAILNSGGFQLRHDLPEVDELNFAPRLKIPVLMLNGRYDTGFPLELSQLPLFHALGTPAAEKRHVIYEAGHGDFPHREEVRECLDWLDKYLGPVRH
jgi:dienelactone hydrolase